MKCIIFDSDGTLVDSELLNCQALSAELGESGIDIGARELLDSYRGWQLSAELEELQQRHGVALDIAFVDRFRDRALALFTKQLQPIAGVAQALRQLSQPLCVASNGPAEKLRLALVVTALDQYFGDNVFSAYDVGIFKPDPGLFLYAANAMGYAPADCIVVEDSEVGIQAAHAAGMRSVFYNPEQLSFAVPDTAIEITTMDSLVASVQQA